MPIDNGNFLNNPYPWEQHARVYGFKENWGAQGILMETKDDARKQLEQALKEAFTAVVDCEEAYAKKLGNDAASSVATVNTSNLLRSFLKTWLYQDDSFSQESTNASGSFLFVLQKNISVTDISHPEITFLLEQHCRPVFVTDLGKPTFRSNSEYVRFANQCLFLNQEAIKADSWPEVRRQIDDRIRSSVTYYSHFFLHTIVANFYSTSVLIHVPKSLSINIDRVVFESGYINSVGHSVYIRKSDAADFGPFEAKIASFLDQVYKQKPIYFVPYSDEFFAGDDASVYSMRNGLTEIKMSARKHYIGDLSMLQVLSALSSSSLIKDRLYIAQSSEWEEERNASGADDHISLIMIVDRTVRYSKTQRRLEIGDDRYISCYAQFLWNDNQLHVFKESKPGWSGPVTLPHTLGGAMVNISRRRLNYRPAIDDDKGPKPLVVIDPFCGSCTKLIDIAQRLPSASIIGLDRDPLVPIMIKDNLQFFASSVSELRQFAVAINSELERSKIDPDTLIRRAKQAAHARLEGKHQSRGWDAFLASLGLLLQEIAGAFGSQVENLRYGEFQKFGDRGFSQATVDKIQALSHEDRIWFYICWRGLLLGSFRFQFGLKGIGEVLRSVVERFARELTFLEVNQRRESESQSLNEDALIRTKGIFSDHVQIRSSFFHDLGKKLNIGNETDFQSSLRGTRQHQFSVYQVTDSILALEKAIGDSNLKADLFITDPPYGVNRGEGGADTLEQLFFQVSTLAAQMLGPKGVCCVALPSFSRNGRQVAYYESKDMFVRQFVTACRSQNREVVTLAELMPENHVFPRAPFRWVSDRGVSRHVLLFSLD